MQSLSAVVLAAGLGKRMGGDKPKVLARICGAGLIEHVLLNLGEAGINDVAVICGHRKELVEQAVAGRAQCFEQKQRLGTAHAVMQAGSFIAAHGGVTVVLCGDAPLVDADTLNNMYAYMREQALDMCVLSAEPADPASYGRIIRDKDGRFLKITERKDCTAAEAAVREVNSGTMMFDSALLNEYLPLIKNENAQHEYYLTDLAEIFAAHGKKTGAYKAENADVVLGANDRWELYLCEKALRRCLNRRLMLSGVRMIDSDTAYIDRGVSVGTGTVIGPNVAITGKTTIGANNSIASSRISDCEIGENNIIEYAVIEDSCIASCVSIGPFTHIRAGTVLANNTKVGSFAETKNAVVGEGSKVPHLIYAGDCEIGKNVNLGCGVITANYDGKNKHKTVIGDNSFIGCNTNLIAPINVGEGSFVAAGTTVSRDVPPGTFVIARAEEKRRDAAILDVMAGRKKQHDP